ncbi:uncharacterized protein LOC107270768 isoform X2 [Cephus cinctus]|nr:uncharacterized protein LOC107270768 isoform X2 [Cephus cinctus]XP_024943825.1 uncharacterized protein LOC107270768 isoform X2 [Cephus cinctus]XP_024943826.1 uncharacterized protein LOC107270768 isoform X2 [Cephus cinctus]XP_024943827.1 uncharacterized protein LOC107270768 isoform X2 [Cephus cinctus]XP_024943828.1 uncharacterized protein LOC107270768 isoform X2 [Cephus cinctus]
MRKPSYQVQYWVDTGMPPYKALDENNHSDPGSSLSEYEQSPLSASNHFKLAQCDNIQPAVRCTSSSSSIDTAVYILSNANTTKKADTIAIMEGAKPYNNADASGNAAIVINQCKTPIPVPKSILQPQTVASDIHSETTEIIFHNRNSQRPSGPLKNNKNTRSPLILDNEKENSLSDDTQTDNELNCSLTSVHFERLLKSPLFNNTFYNKTAQYSSKKPDILDVPSQSTSTAYRAQNANNLESDSSEETSQRVSMKKSLKKSRTRRMARADNAASKALHRRKLYTDRNSPVDLITPVVKNVGKLSPIKEAVKAKQSLHPALETPHSTQDKTSMIMRRAKMRARMKMKRASLLSSTLGETSHESDPSTSINSTIPNNESVNDATELQEVTAAKEQDTAIAPCNLGETWKVLSANLNPVVRLQRIDVESWMKLMTSERRNTTIEDKNPVNQCTLTKQNLLDMEERIRSANNNAITYSITKCSYVETVDSNQSTIIMCKCTDNSVQSKTLNDSRCNDNFDIVKHCFDSSKNPLEEDIDCENNNNSAALEDALKLRMSIEASNKRPEHQMDQEAIDGAEVPEIMKESETRDRIVPSLELRRSETEKISKSSVRLLPRSVDLQNQSKTNWQPKVDPVKKKFKRVLRSANRQIRSNMSKSNIKMTLRKRSQEQVDRMQESDDDEISYTSSSIKSYISDIKSIEETKREAIANAEKLIIRLERLPSNILPNKIRKYENSGKKSKVVEFKEMPRECQKLSEQLKVVKFTKKLLSKFHNNSNNALDNSLSCSEESSTSDITKEIDIIKNPRTMINSNSSKNGSTTIVTIGTSTKSICMSSGDCSESILKSSQSANWLTLDLMSSANEDDDIFNVVKSTEKNKRRKSMRKICNISDTSSTNSSTRITRSRASSLKKSSNVKEQSSDVPNKMEKTKRNDYSSSEILSKDSRKGSDTSSTIKSREILTVNDIIYNSKRITRSRSKTLPILCTETGWRTRKIQRTTRNRLCGSAENMSESSDTLQNCGHSVQSRKLRSSNSLISSDSSAVSRVKKKTSPLVTLNRRSNLKKLPKKSFDETVMTSNSAMISTRSKGLIYENGLKPENAKSTSPRKSQTPLLKKAECTSQCTRVLPASLDSTSDSTDGIIVDQKSIGSILKKRKLDKDVQEKSVLPKNVNEKTMNLSKFRGKYRNNVSDMSSSSSDLNGRYTKLLSPTKSKFTRSKNNSQINTTCAKLTNETKSIKPNGSLTLIKYFNNTSDESLISFSSSRDNFEKSKKISITEDTMRISVGKKSSEVEKPVVYQAITFHQNSESDDY